MGDSIEQASRTTVGKQKVVDALHYVHCTILSKGEGKLRRRVWFVLLALDRPDDTKKPST